MNNLTNEQYEKLKKYEKHLRRATQNYCYGLFSVDFNNLYEIYTKIGGKKNLTYSCNTCCLILLKELAKKYYEYQQSEQETELKKETESEPEMELEKETESEPESELEIEPKKKATKKSKTKTKKKTTKKTKNESSR